MNRPITIIRTFISVLVAFTAVTETRAQMLAVRSNLLMDAAMTPNLGFEMVVGEKTTLSVNAFGNYRPWGKDMKMVALQPEYRYFFSGRPMHKHFVGIGGIVAGYDMTYKSKVYDGHAFGAGLTFGYVWGLGKRLNLDFHAGFGLVAYKHKEYFEQDNYDTEVAVDGRVETNANGCYLLPTDIGVSITYILR